MADPSLNGANGERRDERGRFAKGNSGGPGNPHAKRANQLRSAMYRSVKVGDMRQIVQSLVEEAKGGNVQAAREVLDRCLGKPIEADLIERLATLEQHLEQLEQQQR
jgi:hypothetical protein